MQRNRPIKKAPARLNKLSVVETEVPEEEAAPADEDFTNAPLPPSSQVVGSPLSDVGRKLLNEERDRLSTQMEKLDDEIRNAEEGLRMRRDKRADLGRRLAAIESDLT